jgi:hypothetical protein
MVIASSFARPDVLVNLNVGQLGLFHRLDRPGETVGQIACIDEAAGQYPDATTPS